MCYNVNGDNMELRKAIEDRRSIRKFVDQEVSDEILLDIIKQATLAPSGHNRQPWQFQIVKADTKDKIADMLIDKMKDVPGNTSVHTAMVMKEANALINVYLDENSSVDNVVDVLSIGGAIENMLLTVTDLGLGAVWIANVLNVREEIKTLVGNKEIISCIAIGYKNQEPHARPRKELSEVVLNKLD